MRRWAFCIWLVIWSGRKGIPWTLDNLHIVLPWLAVAGVVGWLLWEALRKPRVRTVPDITFLAVSNSGRLRCAICRDEVAGDVTYCARCHAPHHRECFRFVGNCSVYACRSRRAA
jgi:hypothetical protein